MSRRHGKYAYVNGIPCTQAWQTSKSGNPTRYAASCVPDGTAVADGNTSESGSMRGLGYMPPMPDGDEFAFIGVASAKVGEIRNYVGDILVTETTINVPVKGGGVIDWSANFNVQGELDQETSTQYVDSTRNVAPSAKNGKVSIEDTPGSGTFTDVVVQNIRMTFRRPVADSVIAGLMEYESGNFEADITFDIEDDDRDNPLYDVNFKTGVRVYVTPTLFYLFNQVHFGEKSNFQVDRTNNSLVGYTVNGMFSGLKASNALGQILYPGGAVLWGGEAS